MSTISLDTAGLITERSKRTWQRRAAEGQAVILTEETRGRTMISLTDVAPLICIPMETEDLEILALADSGDAVSQSDMGQLFASHKKTEIALHWIKLATEQEEPDAMQILGRMYAAGDGVPQDDNLAMMWIAKAAAHGHAIAQAQMNGLRPGAPR